MRSFAEIKSNEKIGKTGETPDDIADRIYELYQEVSRKYIGRKVLLVSHAGPITLLQEKIQWFSGVTFGKGVGEDIPKGEPIWVKRRKRVIEILEEMYGDNAEIKNISS